MEQPGRLLTEEELSFYDEQGYVVVDGLLSKEEIERTKTFSAPVVTEITQATAFYPAEEYHQDFYQKNPIRYKFYRLTCGRDSRLAALWGDDGSHSERS